MGNIPIVVTRPQGQADTLLEALGSISNHVHYQPLVNIQPLPDNDTQHKLRQTMLNLDHYQSIIAISKNAAEIGLDWLDRYWPQPPSGLNWYGVGPTTADKLRDAALNPVYQPVSRYDSEGLLDLDSLQQVQDQKILIWRGIGGRETLSAILRQRGAQVDYAELYQRKPIRYSITQWQQVLHDKPLLLVSSGQALDIIEQQVPMLKDNIRALLVPGERLSQRAEAHGYNVIQAASARDSDTLAAVQQWPFI